MTLELRNWIDGEPARAVGGKTLPNFEPATGQQYGTVPDSDERDVQLAIAAAKRAFPAWSALSLEERSRYLRKIAERIEARAEELALAESRDTGKPVSLARRMDIARSAQNFAFFADAITQVSTECHATSLELLNFTLRQSLGVVATISPWNLPLYLLTWKVAPALAAGNTVVAKPSEVTPATAHFLGEICREVGLPPGVLNLVHGTGPAVGGPLCTHPDVAAISFTGSTRTGAEISRAAGPLFKKLSLEMGGKNPNLIFADCDFEQALATTVRSAFLNQGQICLCGSRIFVERPIYEKFRDALVARVRSLRVGDPMVEVTDQGAVVSELHHGKILSALQTARSEGGRILAGGGAARVPGRCEKGWFIEPTLIEGLTDDCRTNQEEIFGPVATIQPFDREDDAIASANSTRYGLAATVWTRDLDRAHRVAQRLHSGIVWVNCWLERDLRTPFGGVKDSGVGREGGFEALRFFTEPKNVCLRIQGAGSRGKTP